MTPQHARWTEAGLLGAITMSPDLVWQEKIPNGIGGSVGADHQSSFRADPDLLKPYVADGKPVERARGSAAENPNSALTIVYGHYFCPTQDQVFVCPHQKIACCRTALPT